MPITESPLTERDLQQIAKDHPRNAVSVELEVASWVRMNDHHRHRASMIDWLTGGCFECPDGTDPAEAVAAKVTEAQDAIAKGDDAADWGCWADAEEMALIQRCLDLSAYQVWRVYKHVEERVFDDVRDMLPDILRGGTGYGRYDIGGLVDRHFDFAMKKWLEAPC